MAELKDKNIEELLDEALEYTNNYFSLYDVKQVIMSRFAEKDKVIEWMAEELISSCSCCPVFCNVRCFNSYVCMKRVIKYSTEQAKQELQADKEKADE